MSTLSKKSNFIDSDEGRAARQQLQNMVTDRIYVTKPSYSANANLYPNHLMPFVDKHMEYLRTHPMLNPTQYLSNLRLMTRVK